MLLLHGVARGGAAIPLLLMMHLVGLTGVPLLLQLLRGILLLMKLLLLAVERLLRRRILAVHIRITPTATRRHHGRRVLRGNRNRRVPSRSSVTSTNCTVAVRLTLTGTAGPTTSTNRTRTSSTGLAKGSLARAGTSARRNGVAESSSIRCLGLGASLGLLARQTSCHLFFIVGELQLFLWGLANKNKKKELRKMSNYTHTNTKEAHETGMMGI